MELSQFVFDTTATTFNYLFNSRGWCGFGLKGCCVLLSPRKDRMSEVCPLDHSVFPIPFTPSIDNTPTGPHHLPPEKGGRFSAIRP